MGLLGSPNIEKMKAERDLEGLAACLDDDDALVALEAAQALAELDDWRGTSFLLTSLEDADADVRGAAAELLGELGDTRAVPGLRRALGDPDESVRQSAQAALEAIGGEEAQQALAETRQDEAAPEEAWTWPEEEEATLPAEPVQVGPFPTAEEHLERADRLEDEQVLERALVECDLALRINPAWADAWNLRGIILEDLERGRQAQFAYRKALAFEPNFTEAQENLADLESRIGPADEDYDELTGDLDGEYADLRRDAAAQLGALGFPMAVGPLIAALEDPDREVVLAAIESLGELKNRQAAEPLRALHERTWTMRPELIIDQITHQIPNLERWRLEALQDWQVRAAAIRALGQIGDAAALLDALRFEFETSARQNAALQQEGLPGLEDEKALMLEIGAYALVDAGDTAALQAATEEQPGGAVPALAAWALDALGRQA